MTHKNHFDDFSSSERSSKESVQLHAMEMGPSLKIRILQFGQRLFREVSMHFLYYLKDTRINFLIMGSNFQVIRD
jgi:hypothetical protein